jgi:hypothetical protein
MLLQPAAALRAQMHMLIMNSLQASAAKVRGLVCLLNNLFNGTAGPRNCCASIVSCKPAVPYFKSWQVIMAQLKRHALTVVMLLAATIFLLPSPAATRPVHGEYTAQHGAPLLACSCRTVSSWLAVVASTLQLTEYKAAQHRALVRV